MSGAAVIYGNTPPRDSARTRQRWWLKAISVCAVALMLTACFAHLDELEPSVMTQHEATTNASYSELRDWVIAEVDAVSELTGLHEEWVLLVKKELRWAEDQDEILNGYTEPCNFWGDGPHPASVDVVLRAKPADADPIAIAEQVRDYWQSQGWTVSTVYENYYRADRDDGAELSIEGVKAETGNYIYLSVTSACSNHGTVAR